MIAAAGSTHAGQPLPVPNTGAEGPNRPPTGRIPRSHLALLLAVSAFYVAVISYLCQLRFDNFYAGAFDLGVNEQLLWTGGHGYLLYETPDRLITGVHSFLEIHSTYIALGFAPVYAAAPYPSTLFVLQSVAVASSIFPLYLICRLRGVRPGLVFPFLALFLVNFALLGALLFDFHWETFLPMEVLWYYYLVIRRSYYLALVPLAAGTLTLELFPFLAIGVALLLLYERLRAIGLRPRALLRDFVVRFQLLLVFVSLVAFLVVIFAERTVIPGLVGSSGPIGVYAGINPSYRWTATSGTLWYSALYWLLLIASLGFFPVFSPKSLLPSVPWFVESVLFQPYYSSAFGNHYALLALATLGIAYVEGFARWTKISEDRGVASGTSGALFGCAAVAEVVAFGGYDTFVAASNANHSAALKIEPPTA